MPEAVAELGDVELVLSGTAFAGWEQVSISRTMEAGAGSFELAVSERFAQSGAVRPIRPLEACELRVGSDVLVTGFVDEVTIQLDAGAHGIVIRGRDRLADLIDSAPDVTPAEWANVSLFDLVVQLARPFGISVRSTVPRGAVFSKVALNPGQRAFELIEKLCSYREVLPVSDGQGGLLLTRAGVDRIAYTLAEGVNVLEGSVTYSASERFSSYIVKGQAPTSGFSSDQAGKAKGRATDSELTAIGRYRPLLIVASEATDLERCQRRARWEALTRAARGARVSLTVAGWRLPDGSLWRPNTLVRVESDTLGVSGELLLTSVTFARGASGTTTALELMRADAFRPAPDQVPATPPSYFSVSPVTTAETPIEGPDPDDEQSADALEG
jgi:prophage tail gpP-like protein